MPQQFHQFPSHDPAGVEFILTTNPRLYYKDSGGTGTNGDTQSASLSTGTEVLYTNIVDRDTDEIVEAFKNGSSVTISSATDLSSVGSVNADELTIGANNSGGNLYNGKTKEIIIYASDQTDNRTAIEANIGEHYSISGIPAFDNSVNGFVETWYDQLGSSNVTQSTSTFQPKIVNGGALLQDASGNPYLEFDGTDDFYNINKTTFRNVSHGYASAVAQFNDTTATNEPVYYASTGTSPTQSRALLGKISSGGAKIVAGARRLDTDGFRSSQEPANTNKNLLTGLYQWGDGEIQLFVNGAAKTAHSFSSGSGNTSDTESNSAFIGRLGSSYYDGKIYELIIYNTDQSGNRQALETNMANEYNITLS